MSAAHADDAFSTLQVQRNTGFAPGLYTGAELDAKAIQVDSQLAEPMYHLTALVSSLTVMA